MELSRAQIKEEQEAKHAAWRYQRVGFINILALTGMQHLTMFQVVNCTFKQHANQ